MFRKFNYPHVKLTTTATCIIKTAKLKEDWIMERQVKDNGCKIQELYKPMLGTSLG